MKYSILFFTALWIVLINYSRALREDDMDTLWSDINLFSPSVGSLSSGILKSHFGSWYTSNRNKTVYVKVDPGYSIQVSIKYIDFRPRRQDSLKLFSVNGQVTPVTYTNTGYFRDKRYYAREQETFYVPNGQLGITFSTGKNSLTAGYDGFQLTYTAIANYGLCQSRDFHCQNSRCIAHVLECDGHNHCGDGSSLKNCSSFTPGKTAGIICGVIFLLIAVGCGVYIVVRRARNSTIETHTVVTSHPPPSTNLPSYPPGPGYPQPGTYYPPPPPPYSQGISNPTYH